MLSDLPNELLDRVLSDLPLSDARCLSVTSKQMYRVSQSKIWRAPRFKKKISHQQLGELSRLPIQELHTRDFESCFESRYMKTLQEMQLLKTLFIDHDYDYDYHQQREFKPSDLKPFGNLNVDLVVYMHSMKTGSDDEFRELVDALSSIQLKSLIIDRYCGSCLYFTINELSRLLSFPVTEIDVNSFDIDERNVDEFISLLSMFKQPCKVLMKGAYFNGEGDFDSDTGAIFTYTFTLQDMENIVKNNIKVTHATSSILRRRNVELHELRDFISVLENMAHLQRFDIDDYLDVPTLRLLTNLPVKSLSTTYFKNMDSSDIDEIVEALSNIRHLEELMIDHWCGYKLSPNDFQKFSHLPVKHVSVGGLQSALDITDENVEVFRKIMEKMKIRKITGSENIRTFRCGEDHFQTI